ncbi:hypothetical protein [Halopseudomonas pelagia]|uniref:hypothetical protein n=1 Tax=Halopseudomonas pelagia TaxID=553151 RepID=UPI00039ED81C|nr:hypothetical protein [Halopseudomonas pelagia]|tara:strand:+ start:462 stop:887 length:426 start_codon:yes stop_codon:yes gene_type:complete
MSRPIVLLALLACLSGPSLALAQQPSAAGTPASQDTNAASTDLGTDIGTLQMELAQVEAERQRLAEQLAQGTDNELLEKLKQKNRELLDRQAQSNVEASALLEAQRQEWFMVGGGTVLASLIVGFLLASMGRRSKRNEWLN